MTEPTTTTAAIASGLSAFTLALFGVDYYALVWGLVGAMFAQGMTSTMTRKQAIIYVSLATFSGAAIGTGFQALFFGSTNKPVLVLFSLAGGFAAQKILDGVVSLITRRLEEKA